MKHTHTILIEEATGTIEYELTTSTHPDDRPIKCTKGHHTITGQEVPPLPFPTLAQKLLTLANAE